jgi:hypothetical protein
MWLRSSAKWTASALERVKMSVPRVGVSVKVSASAAVRSAAEESSRGSPRMSPLSVIARLMDRPLAIALREVDGVRDLAGDEYERPCDVSQRT